MGWLRDFMTLAEPPISSFGKLAELCLDHPDWPDHCRPKPRSLSTLFSKLDRKQDLDWLRDRIEVQQVLGVLLKRTVNDVRAAIGETPYVSDDRFLRLSDIRYAREVDLTQEDLPPGIPRVAYDPPSWSPTWWLAGPGSGRSLNAAWLRSRGISHTANIRSRDDLDRLPTRGPLFLEIDSLVTADELRLSSSDLETLRARQRPVCFAASFAPPEDLLVQLVESAPPQDYLPELVDWVGERLDDTGHFHADRAEQWMRRVAIPAGAVKNFGDALGLLGMIDEVHPRSLSSKSLDELGEHFVRRRVREANEEISVSPRLADDAFGALQECAARVLVSGSNALHSSHAIDEWTALLSSPGNEDVPDPEWFTAALRGALGNQISRRDLRRAARKLQPGAFQLTKSLEAARLLVRTNAALSRDEDGAERHLRPRWLVSLLSARAAQEVLRLTPSQWGRVLLNGKDAARTVDALLNSAKRGDFSAPFAVVDDFDPELPEVVAALEAALIASGLAALEGYDVPEELTSGLLAHSAASMLVLDGVPTPRLTFESEKAGFFQTVFYRVALLSLAREVPFPHPHLDPIRSESTALKSAFLEACQTLLLPSDKYREMGGGKAVGIIECLDQLVPRESSDTPDTLPRPLSLRLAESLGGAPLHLYEEALKTCALDHIVAYAVKQGSTERSALSKCWRFLESVPTPDAYFVSSDLSRKAWGCLPASELRSRVKRGLPINWQGLLPHQYSEWLGASDSNELPPEAGEKCPLDAALLCLDEKGTAAFDPSTLGVIIGRAGARVSPYFRTVWEAENQEEVDALLEATPRSVSRAVTDGLPETEALLSRPAPLLESVRRFLSRNVRERHPGFEESYERLTEIEVGVGDLRRL